MVLGDNEANRELYNKEQEEKVFVQMGCGIELAEVIRTIKEK